jgi:hypothetical protein
MAVPEIVTVFPSEIRTLGPGLFEIYGHNFRTPATPAVDLIPVPEHPPTVEVLVDGVLALNVDVASDGHLVVLAPPHAEGDVDVTVRNIDNDGDPIVGEIDTKTEAIRYLYPGLQTDIDLVKLTEGFVLEIRKQVHPNVTNLPHTDYDQSPYKLRFIAELPAIIVTGPELLENALSTVSGDRYVNDDGETFTVQRQPRTVDVGFEITGISDNTRELLNLMELVEQFFHQNRTLSFTDVYGDSAELEIDFQTAGDLRVTSRSNEDNIRQFRGSVVVREFNVPGANVARGAYLRDVPELETLRYAGENLEAPVTGISIGPIPVPAYHGAPQRGPGDSEDC